MGAALKDRVLATPERQIAAVHRRTIVAGVDDDGVVAQAEVVQFLEDGCHVSILRFHHGFVYTLIFLISLYVFIHVLVGQS